MRGFLTMMKIDWITATRKRIVSDDAVFEPFVVQELFKSFGQTTFKIVRNAAHYHLTLEAENTMQVRLAEDHVALVFPGQSIEGSGIDILEKIRELGFKLTRLDIACDIKQEIDIPALARKYAKLPSARHNALIQSSGATLYIGSRSSTKMLRIYDKRAEQRAEHPWTRVEIELKQDAARNAASLLLQNRNFDFALKAMQDMLALPQSKLSKLLQPGSAAEKLRSTIGRNVAGSAERWLTGQVAASFEKLIRDDKAAAERVFRLWIEIWNSSFPDENE
jgi:hypothetical protein